LISLLEGQEAKNQMQNAKYSGDIEDYIVKMKRLNNLVGMSAVTLTTTIERHLSKDLRRSIFLIPSTDLDDEWIQTVVKARKIEKSILVEEKLLKGHQDKPQEKKSNPVKGEKTATGRSSKEGKTFNQGLTQRFEQPKDRANLTPAEREGWSKRLREITIETLRERRLKRVCMRCGNKSHNQWFCLKSQLKAAIASALPTETV
jgi:hypothetical protein